jgi:hypothetical protein
MKIKKRLLAILLVTIGFSAYAQHSEENEMRKNSIYFDTGVIPGYHAFVNYERSFHQGKWVSWYGRMGAGYGGFLFAGGGFGALGAVTMLTGKKNSHFELSTGLFRGKEDRDAITLPIIDIGYRYQKPEGGLVFKAKIGILGVGFGIGYAF